MNLATLRGLATRRPLALAPSPDNLRIDLYGVIGWDIWADDILKAISDSTASTIDVVINSPGGDAFDGIALYNALSAHPAQVTVDVQGLAASAASIVAMAGDKRIMRPGATMMIHDALTFAAGNAADLRKVAESLDTISDGIAGIYAATAGGPVETWRQAMRDETWLTADEAVTAGLASLVDAKCGTKPKSSDGGDGGNPDDEPDGDEGDDDNPFDNVVRGMVVEGWSWQSRETAPPPTRLIAALKTPHRTQRPMPSVTEDQRVTALRAALTGARN